MNFKFISIIDIIIKYIPVLKIIVLFRVSEVFYSNAQRFNLVLFFAFKVVYYPGE